MKDVYGFYEAAKKEITVRGYAGEAEYVNNLHFNKLEVKELFYQYVFVVVSSGMKNQVAMKIYDKFRRSGDDPDTIGHPGKREAIRRAGRKYPWWFSDLQKSTDKLEYLETLPWIGPITKYHLARNIGLDCAKPDRHLMKLAERFEFKDVQAMCQSIADRTGDRIGVVDVILWRYCNLKGSD